MLDLCPVKGGRRLRMHLNFLCAPSFPGPLPLASTLSCEDDEETRRRTRRRTRRGEFDSVSCLASRKCFGLDFLGEFGVSWNMAEKSASELPRELRLLFPKGNDASARENYDYAIDLFNQVLAKEPTLYECRKALRTAQIKKAGAGTGFFKKMLSTAGSQPLVAKGQLALRKDPVEALQIAEQILNSDPGNSGAHRIVVEAATAMQMPRTAALSLEILVANSPKDRDVAIKFANALADSGEVVRAERMLTELSRSFPADQDVALALKNI